MDYKKIAEKIKKEIEGSINTNINLEEIITKAIRLSDDYTSKLCQQMYEAGKKDGYAQAKAEMKGV